MVVPIALLLGAPFAVLLRGGPSLTPLVAETAPALPQSGTVIRDCPTCPEMVLIPAGNFVMGVPPKEDGGQASDDDARPQHRVTIAYAFWLGRYPVTRAEYAAFVQDTGYAGGTTTWRGPGFRQTDRDPVVNVSREDAAAYVAWLSRKTGKTYRLPSEAEWEYAARAGTATARFWGDERAVACRYANVADETLRKKTVEPANSYFACDDGYAETSPVGTFQPNGFGLYDMLGNVWQWSADCYNGGYVGAPRDGSIWTTGNCSLRVLRGGAWNGGPADVRAGTRSWGVANMHVYNVGFRLARTL